MKAKASVPSLDTRELDELILKVLSRSRFGLPANKIHKELPLSYRRSVKDLVARLDDLLAGGRVHAWEPPRGEVKKPPAPIYSLEDLEPLIASSILELLKARTLTLAEIKKTFPVHIQKYLLNFVDPLIKNGKIKWHPPVKGKRLGLQEPNPADFLSAEIKKLFEKGESHGLSHTGRNAGSSGVYSGPPAGFAQHFSG
jgi:hypothetical protein